MRSRQPGFLMLAALFVLGWAQLALALDPQRTISQHAIELLRSSDGLPQNSVQAIAQTADGYLWFGTQEGLARFDGVHFSVFDKHNTPALQHNSIQSLIVSKNGDLWIGTFVGGATRMRDGVFSTLTSADGLSSNQVRTLVEAPDGSLWFGTNSGLDHYVDGKFESFTIASGMRNDRILALRFDREGSLWVGTDGAGVARYRNGKFEWFDTSDGLAGNQIRAIWQSRSGEMWFGSYGGGASRLRDGEWTTFTEADGLAGDHVADILEDRDNTIWFATSAGVSRWSRGKLSSLDASNGLPNGLNVALFEDREGSLWIGSNGGGVARLRDAAVINYTTDEGLSGGNARVVLAARDGSMWIGTDQGLSRVRDGTTRQIAGDGLQTRIFSLAEDSAGALWVGTQGGGLLKLENEKVVRRITQADGLSNDVVRAILPTRDGALMVGTDIGLNRIEGDGDVIKIWRRADGLSADPVTALLQARDGSVVIATNGGGVNRLIDGRFSAVTSQQGLASNVVFALYESADGAIWAGTDGGGICRIEGSKVACVGSAQGLYDDLVVQILDDQDGRLWMASNRGVFNVPLLELQAAANDHTHQVTSTHFGLREGMASPECHGGSQPAGALSKDGRLWFPTLAGVAVFDPANARTNPLPPPVLIENVVVDGTRISISEASVFAPAHEQLEVHYTALSFINTPAMMFKYRLEGFNSEWVDAGTRRVAYFTNLGPGDYVFRVIASNSDGVWNNEGAELAFTRTPQWIETLWFKLAVALGSMAAIALVFRLLSQQQRRRQAQLERLVEDRTRALEHSNAELVRLSMTDPLTGAWNRRGASEALELEWQTAIEAGKAISGLMIDLDSFKAYNDHYGHAAGDECLKAVVGILVEAMRDPRHFVARLGGEEFLVLLADTELTQALDIAEDLRTGVEAAALSHDYAAAGKVVTISIGVACMLPCTGEFSSELLAAADHALYRAKNAGRNRIFPQQVD